MTYFVSGATLNPTHSLTHFLLQRRLEQSSDELDDPMMDSFFDMLSRYQARRIDDQRCLLRTDQHASPVTADNKENIDLCGQSARTCLVELFFSFLN